MSGEEAGSQRTGVGEEVRPHKPHRKAQKMVCCGRNPALAMCVAYGVERIATEPAHLPPTRLPEDAAVETDVHRLRLLCRGTFEGKVKDLCCLLFSYATLFFFLFMVRM